MRLKPGPPPIAERGWRSGGSRTQARLYALELYPQSGPFEARRTGNLGSVSPVAVNLLVVVRGVTVRVFAADGRPELAVLGYDRDGLACGDHAGLDFGCDHDATLAAYQKLYDLIFIRH